MKIIKFVTYFFLALLGSMVIAFLIASWKSGQSLGETWEKLTAIPAFEMIGVPLLSIFAMVLAAVVHIILHESGHMLFGLASGYRFLSFRVFNLAFINDGGRVRMKKYSVAGTLGQCLMLPPEVPADRLSGTAYNIGGVAMNLLLCVIFGAALCFCKGHPVAAVFCMMFVIVGAFLIIMNGIPMIAGGVPNDGMNALKLRKNATSRKAFALLLKTHAMVQNGTRPRDIGDELFLRPDEVDFAEPIQVNSILTLATKLLDCGDFDGSLALNREVIDKARKVKIFAFEAKCEVASILLMQGKADEAKAMLNPQEMKQVQAYARSQSSKQRLLFLLALKADGDRAKAQEILDQTIKNRNSYMMRGEAEMDLEMMTTEISAIRGRDRTTNDTNRHEIISEN